ncbi:uncharacterized protein LOC129926704 [Biomphalaria glabrata]|uniref:Uncharacterized protein LOC129926704 n=1 Tax=Biomphalaria glabrata TaxID=6526 RepID=A0A9W3AM10_BIOGL|nr:uncharacterized protein LOC129926704 [Biomphalaria glabrata]
MVQRILIILVLSLSHIYADTQECFSKCSNTFQSNAFGPSSDRTSICEYDKALGKCIHACNSSIPESQVQTYLNGDLICNSDSSVHGAGLIDLKYLLALVLALSQFCISN